MAGKSDAQVLNQPPVAFQRAFAMLVGGLKSSDIIVRADAARLLGELGRRAAVGPLVEYVKRERHYTKVAGFYALGQLGERSAAQALRPLVNKPNVPDDWYWYGCKSVRAAAAVALLALDDAAGAAYLHSLADIQEDVFYSWFGSAILRLMDASVTAPVKARLTVDALLNPGSRGVRLSEPGVLVMTAETLGLLGGARACAKLCELLGHPSRYVRGQAAVSLLAAEEGRKYRSQVARLAAKDPTDFTRIKAAFALARGGGESGAVLAAAVKKVADNFDRAVAIECVGLLGEQRFAGAIVPHLRHKDAYVRQCAVEALDRILARTPRPTGKLREFAEDDKLPRALLQDSSPRVRLQAAKFLAARSIDGKVR